MTFRVGIVGASGYAGVELLKLCAAHGDLQVEVAAASGHAGVPVSSHTPSLAAAYPDLVYAATDPAGLSGLDLVFLALPHGRSQELVPALVPEVGVIVDLAADFRLRDPALYPVWYGEEHRAVELLERFVYGLPEIARETISRSRWIAAPGCYPTAAILALAPFVGSGAAVSDGIIVDAASGVSGAGRAPKPNLQFGAVDEDFTAYGLLDHRHTAEMEQALGAQVLFTPHLAPMVRGILATCYARPVIPVGERGALTTQGAMEVLHRAYDAEPFVVVTDAPPSTKAVAGSNCVHLTARVDPRTGWLVVVAAIDNLIKGAAGQAVQCANLALGLPEGTALPNIGAYP